MRRLVLFTLCAQLSCGSFSITGAVGCEDTFVEAEAEVIFLEPEPGSRVSRDGDRVRVEGKIRAEPRVVRPGRYKRYEGEIGAGIGARF